MSATAVGNPQGVIVTPIVDTAATSVAVMPALQVDVQSPAVARSSPIEQMAAASARFWAALLSLAVLVHSLKKWRAWNPPLVRH